MANHNLDIHNYSFHEIMDLFELDIDNVTVDELKRAKRKVVMIHPDKSKLPKEYFLFYKKAFDIVIRMYGDMQKVSQKVENQEYFPEMSESSLGNTKQMKHTLNSIPQETFQKTFNKMYETHVKKPIDTEKNNWFSQEESMYNHHVSNPNQMNSVLEQVKQQQQSIIKYQGVVPIQSNYHSNSFYEDDSHNDEETEYMSSDVFSKLKYEDVRKVHRDQTVFNISESQYDNIPKYRNVQDYERARNVNHIKPMEQNQATQMIQEQERILQEKMKRKQYQSELNSIKYADVNKQVMSNFLKIQN
jgi:hypothetical protein